MSRSKAFLLNASFASMLQVVTVIAGFIIPRVMLTAYGSEINGLVTSVTQFVNYFKLVEAGLASAAVYSLYKPLAEKRHAEINAILSAARRFYNKSGYIFVSLVIGLAVTYPFLIKTPALTNPEIMILVMIVGGTGTLEFFTMAKYRVLLTAHQKVYVISFAGICATILNTLIIVILASIGYSIVTVRAVALFSVFLRSLILHIYVKNKYTFVNYYAHPNNEALKKRWDAFYLQLLGGIHNGVPVILATFFTSLKMVSVYSIFNMVMAGISGILSVAINGLFASFGDIIARGEKEILQKAYEEFEMVYYMIITVAYGCTGVLLMSFVRLYTRGVTDVNYYLPVIGFLFVLNKLAYNIKTPQGMLVISAGLFRETRVQTTIQGLIAIFGGLIFVQFWGLAGILTGSILSDIYRDIDLLFFIPKHVTKTKVRDSFYRILRIFLCLGIILLPFRFIQIDPQSYLHWLKNAFWTGIYASIVVIGVNFVLERGTFLRVTRRFSRLLVKTK